MLGRRIRGCSPVEKKRAPTRGAPVTDLVLLPETVRYSFTVMVPTMPKAS